MEIFGYFFVILSIIFQEILACHEQFIEEEDTFSLNYDDYDTIGDFSSPAIKSSTLICTNISSIADIPHHNFTKSYYDKNLVVTQSHISTLQPLAFVNFYFLVSLRLSEVQLKTIEAGAFENLTYLQELRLDNNELTELPDGVFTSLQRLTILNLDNNKISRISKSVLDGLSKLEVLLLSNNQIKMFDNNLFENMSHLEKLDLSGNPLEKIPIEVIARLEDINLSNILLDRLDFDFSNTTIKYLNLSSNRLSEIDFALLPKLKVLDLSRNRIQFFKNMEMLISSSVFLDNNEVTTIKWTFINVSHILLSHNKIEALQDSLFNKSSNANLINLGFNKISTIHKDTFLGLAVLEYLSLNNNKLKKIEIGAFQDLVRLKYLDLSHNHIEEFPFGTFDKLHNLETLNISSNRLVNLNHYGLISLHDLSTFSFDNNRISSLNIKTLTEHLRFLRLVSLDYNPWKCNDLAKIKAELLSSRVVIAEGESFGVENVHGIACINQNEFKDNNKKNKSEIVKSFNSVEQEPIEIENKILNVGAVIQILLSLMTLFVVCLIFLFMKRRLKLNNNMELLSQMDL